MLRYRLGEDRCRHRIPSRGIQRTTQAPSTGGEQYAANDDGEPTNDGAQRQRERRPAVNVDAKHLVVRTPRARMDQKTGPAREQTDPGGAHAASVSNPLLGIGLCDGLLDGATMRRRRSRFHGVPRRV